MAELRSQARVVHLALGLGLGHALAAALGVAGQALALASFLGLHVLARQLPVWRRLVVPAFGTAVAALAVLPVQHGGDALAPEPGLFAFRGRLVEGLRRAEFGQATGRVHVRGVDVGLRLDAMPRAPLPAGALIEGRGWFEPGSDRHPARLRAVATDLRRVPSVPGTPTVRSAVVTAAERLFRRHLGRRQAAFVLELLLGRGDGLDPAVVRTFRRAGLAHVLAISGLHAACLAACVWLVLALLPWSERTRFAVLAGVLVCYAWLTGLRPPVVRAVTGLVVWRAARLRGRGFAISSALAAAVVTTTIATPRSVGSLGFWLSFYAVAGLGMFAAPIKARLERAGLKPWFAAAISASCAAQLATSALALDAFGYVAPWGIVWTPLCLPFLFGVVCLGFALPVAAIFAPPLAAAGFPVLDFVARTWIDAVSACAQLPGSPIHAIGFPPALLPKLILGLGSAVALVAGSRRGFAATCAAASLVFFVPWPAARGRDFVLLAVGHGQAALFSGRDGSLAVDCGDSIGGGFAARRLQAALRVRRRSRLDHLVLTHGDKDHAGGLAELLLRVRVGHVWLPEAPKSAASVAALRRRRIPFTLVAPGFTLRPLPRVRVLAPLTGGDLSSSNDGALVVDWRFEPGPRIVVPGDQEAAGIAGATRALTGTRCDVLVLPHHASVVPGLDRLIDSLAPRSCFASTSSRRRLHRRFVTGDLARAHPWTTGRDGDLHVMVRPSGSWRFGAGR